MTQLLVLILSTSTSWAQPITKFERYCAQISVPSQPVVTHPNNSPLNDLREVADSASGLDKIMRDNVVMGLDYQDFRAKMANQKITLSEPYHSLAYARAARFKCDILTEAGAGDISTQAHNSPTTEQLERRVDDSGIGVGPAINDGSTTTEPAGFEK